MHIPTECFLKVGTNRSTLWPDHALNTNIGSATIYVIQVHDSGTQNCLQGIASNQTRGKNGLAVLGYLGMQKLKSTEQVKAAGTLTILCFEVCKNPVVSLGLLLGKG